MDTQLQKYIKDMHGQGYGDEAIRQKLLESGWTQEMIDAEIKAYGEAVGTEPVKTPEKEQELALDMEPLEQETPKSPAGKKMAVYLIIAGIFLGAGGAFGALYTDVWNPSWDPFVADTALQTQEEEEVELDGEEKEDLTQEEQPEAEEIVPEQPEVDILEEEIIPEAADDFVTCNDIECFKDLARSCQPGEIDNMDYTFCFFECLMFQEGLYLRVEGEDENGSCVFVQEPRPATIILDQERREQLLAEGQTEEEIDAMIREMNEAYNSEESLNTRTTCTGEGENIATYVDGLQEGYGGVSCTATGSGESQCEIEPGLTCVSELVEV